MMRPTIMVSVEVNCAILPLGNTFVSPKVLELRHRSIAGSQLPKAVDSSPLMGLLKLDGQ
jgi:hypothetical protein